MIIWEGRLDSKGFFLTGNTTVVYTFMWIDLKDGPMVIETPPNVLGIIDDAWFQYLSRKDSKAGRFNVLPTDPVCTEVTGL